MKKGILFLLLCCVLQVSAQLKDYPIQAIDFTKVHFTDKFWLPRIEINRKVTIPASFERCERTGRVKNFEMAAKKEGKFCTVYTFDDTDIYKTIEGAAYSLATYPDPKLDHYLDSLIAIVGAAQEPDGYLYTARTIDPLHPHGWAGATRWEKEREQSHELYNAGHLYEAAVAHYMATKKRTLLNIALKNANLVCAVFGQGKREVAPGHEIVEMGLVKLYRVTGKKEYLDLAKFFIAARGKHNYDKKSNDPWKNGSYWQDDKLVVNQEEAVGHAVRAAYLYSAVADVAALTGDEKMLAAVNHIWDNVVSKKMYLQGGIGAVPNGERFGENYELPNETAYNETCAAIANVYWNQRMFQLHGDSKYIDVLEKVLYNGLISGVGLDGKSFFYTNAMQIVNGSSHKDMEPERSGWFECSCCPTNMARLIPSIPGYVYAQQQDRVYVNLFINSNTSLKVKGREVKLAQENNYPWDGGLKIRLDPKSAIAFKLFIRIPGWVKNEAIPSSLYHFSKNSDAKVTVKINGKNTNYTIDKGYAVLDQQWKPGDEVEITLPMEVRKVVSSEKLVSNKNRIGLQRGPLIYCAEWIDNQGRTSNLIVPENAVFSSEKQDQLGGITALKSIVDKVEVKDNRVTTQKKEMTAIPYFAWANRGKGEMQVWFPEKIEDVILLTK